MQNFIDLTIFLFTVYGASYIVTASVLLHEPRKFLSDYFDRMYSFSDSSFAKFAYDKLAYLLNCTICASVWIAFLFYFVLQSSTLISISSNEYDLLIYCMIAPVFTMYLNNLLMDEVDEND
tara:strand:+ start:291 stop:653 length:363 start_codon:yes stop_codon:yes gene_type:complete